MIISFIIGRIIVNNVKTWYGYLNKPPLCPPPWFFGLAWPINYFLIGFAAAYVYTTDVYGFSEEKTWAWTCFFIEMALNYSWCFLFFQLKWILISAIECVIVEVFAILTIVSL